MKKEITRFDVGSVALMAGTVMAVVSLLFCLLFFSVLSMPFTGKSLGGYERGLVFGGGIFFVILVPIIYGVVGMISGALSAVVYNFVAGRIGGIKIYIRE
ncbi:hypothetical protein [Salmonirosea aquatica]|uniref:DUF3566 domain-containing protein n=1 Tax=Salmonirosea aquatica TaxID=2654236 RepID=A0A7C9FYV5_9BACT|nr:hypothetical protein [Cytophagaceae bacterium SJW1-29]